MATRNHHLIRKYGITEEDYFNLLEAQEGVCKICSNPPSSRDHKANKEGMFYLHIDHDHTDGRVRGLLCTNCNNGLGRFKDRIDLLVKAAEYLRKRAG